MYCSDYERDKEIDKLRRNVDTLDFTVMVMGIIILILTGLLFGHICNWW